MTYPEEVPDGVRKLVGHVPSSPTAADVLLNGILRQFGANKYVLIVQADQLCHNGHIHSEIHSGGLDPDEVKAILIDMAAGYDPEEAKDGN